MPRATLHPYQLQMRDFVLNTPYCAMFLEMGMGKSLTTLSALEMMPDSGNALVIAPKNIARSVWADEVEKWDIAVRTRSLIVNENGRQLKADERHARYQEVLTAEPHLYFVNRDVICDMVGHYKKNLRKNVRELRKLWPSTDPKLLEAYARWPFPTVILDEAQSFKSPTSKRFKALKSVRPYMRRVIELSGTPTPNGLEDLWAEMYLLDGGERLGRTIHDYRIRYFQPVLYVNNVAVKWQVRQGCEDVIHQSVADVCVSMKNTSLKLPPVTYTDMTVHMSKSERKVYERMKKDLVLELPEGEAVASNAAVLTARLSQMASGAIYVNESSEYATIHEQKLDMCSYLIRNEPSPILLCYHFKSDLDMLTRRFAKDGVDARRFDGSPEMIHDWNDGKIPVMMIQPSSAGHGLNLQTGGHVLIWYTLPWNLEEYLQANARLYRQGQRQPVMIYHITCANTIDGRIMRSLREKSLSQDKLLEAVRSELEL